MAIQTGPRVPWKRGAGLGHLLLGAQSSGMDDSLLKGPRGEGRILCAVGLAVTPPKVWNVAPGA